MFPKLVSLGPLTIHTYGLMLATAFLMGTALLARLAEQEGLPRQRAWDLGFVVILSALAGAKLLMVLGNLSYYLNQPSRLFALEFWQAGGAYFGGLLGAIIGSAIYIHRQPQLGFWGVADAAAPAIALGQSMGRVGCFAAGCDYGTPSRLPWAVTYTSQYAHQNVGVPLGVAVHPVQLYESLGAFLIFLVLLAFHRRRRFPGQVFSLYLLSYGALRFLDEFFRGDAGRGFVLHGLLSVPQLISLLLLIAAPILYFVNRPRVAG
ncbi:MAG: prolipoprotein diacylglyceryl transferase [Acidobacteriota bacterium]